MIDWGTAGQWGGDVLALFALIIALGNRRSDAIRDILAQLVGHEKRLGQVETDIDHLPEKDLVHRLELSIEQLKGQMSVIAERVGPIKAVADRMQELMLTEGGHK